MCAKYGALNNWRALKQDSAIWLWSDTEGWCAERLHIEFIYEVEPHRELELAISIWYNWAGAELFATSAPRIRSPRRVGKEKRGFNAERYGRWMREAIIFKYGKGKFKQADNFGRYNAGFGVCRILVFIFGRQNLQIRQTGIARYQDSGRALDG